MPKRKKSLHPIVCGVPSFTALSFWVLAVVQWRERGILVSSPLLYISKPIKFCRSTLVMWLYVYPYRLGEYLVGCWASVSYMCSPCVTCLQNIMFSVIIHGDHNSSHQANNWTVCKPIYAHNHCPYEADYNEWNGNNGNLYLVAQVFYCCTSISHHS